MFFNTLIAFAAVSSSALLNVQAHGTITGVTGANGVQASGFGILASTPRNGATPVPFEQDTSVIRNQEIASGKTGVCGSTKAGGNNDVAAQLAAASQAGLPTAGADGSVTMTLHQVNQDGAGPYTCDVSGDGGNTFQAATVTQQVPGAFGLSLATASNFSLVAQMPAGMACTAGPAGNACIMRCRNPALAGPFGSCVAVAQGNTTAAAATAGTAATAATAATTATAGTAATDATAATGATGAAGGLAGLLGGLGGGAGGAGATGGLSGLLSGLGGAGAGGAASDGASGGLSGLLSGLGGAGAGGAAAKRYINSRVAGKRSGYWLDDQ